MITVPTTAPISVPEPPNREHDLGRKHVAQHVRPDEPFVEDVKAASETGDGATDRQDDRLQVLRFVAEEGYALLVLSQTRQRQPKLRTHQETAEQIDDHEDAKHHVIVDRALHELVAAEGERRDRRDAHAAARAAYLARLDVVFQEVVHLV
jgi:hypothetical protein